MQNAPFDVIIFYGVIATVANWIAWEKGFFSLKTQKFTVDLSWKNTLVIFIIYIAALFGTSILLSNALAPLMESAQLPSQLKIISSIQLASTLIAVLCLYFYFRGLPSQIFKNIWKQKTPYSKSIFYDFFLGISVWFIGFPIVIVVGEIADYLLIDIFHFAYKDQVAVRYLKTMQAYPSLLVLAFISIVIIAPIIEEFIFRGVLQNCFKKHLGYKASLLLSSLCFSFFHFSSSQGATNISLLLSLFVFAYFLGFVYEKQRSLFASIALHMTFNLVSTFRILFTE